jgi:hypothetical protein
MQAADAVAAAVVIAAAGLLVTDTHFSHPVCASVSAVAWASAAWVAVQHPLLWLGLAHLACTRGALLFGTDAASVANPGFNAAPSVGDVGGDADGGSPPKVRCTAGAAIVSIVHVADASSLRHRPAAPGRGCTPR